MLDSIRVIKFPENIQTNGPLIKAKLLASVHTHEEIVDHAQQQAQGIIENARHEAVLIKEQIKKEVAENLKSDLREIRQLAQHNDKAVRDTAAALCVEVCNAVIRQTLNAIAPEQKITLLVDSLLSRASHTRELTLKAHPNQVQMVEESVAQVVARQINIKKWCVEPDPNTVEFEVRICTENGAEIMVSLENILALYEEEIRVIGQEIRPLMNALET